MTKQERIDMQKEVDDAIKSTPDVDINDLKEHIAATKLKDMKKMADNKLAGNDYIPTKLIINKGRPSAYKKGMETEFLGYVASGDGLTTASHKIGVDAETTCNWSKKKTHPFFGTYRTAREIVAERTLNGGISGDISERICMFILKCNFDYIEKKDADALTIKRAELKLKRDEFDARKAGEISESGGINITFELEDPANPITMKTDDDDEDIDE